LGELRPVSQGYDITGEAGDTLAAISRETKLPVLFHVSEPVGHEYPGKHGLPMADFYTFVSKHPECVAIGAHWGGGLPLYGLMPELTSQLANVWFDTAATQLLYDDRIYRQAVDVIGADRILFASDFPLLDQKRQLERVRLLKLDPAIANGVLGGNARQLLGL
jgi:predicted TIM-barrel fold metal-dependent hydrolase